MSEDSDRDDATTPSPVPTLAHTLTTPFRLVRRGLVRVARAGARAMGTAGSARRATSTSEDAAASPSSSPSPEPHLGDALSSPTPRGENPPAPPASEGATSEPHDPPAGTPTTDPAPPHPEATTNDADARQRWTPVRPADHEDHEHEGIGHEDRDGGARVTPCGTDRAGSAEEPRAEHEALATPPSAGEDAPPSADPTGTPFVSDEAPDTYEASDTRLHPSRLPTRTASPDEPALPWWRYRRPDGPPSPRGRDLVGNGDGTPGRGDDGTSNGRPPNRGRQRFGREPRTAAGETHTPAAVAEPVARAASDDAEHLHRAEGLETAERPTSTARLFALLALALGVAMILNAQQWQVAGLSQVLVPAFGLAVTAACASLLARRHPDEPWLARLLVLGVSVKIVGSLLRYLTLVDAFGEVGDASMYHDWGGVRLVEGTHELDDRTGTNFVRYFTYLVYQVIGIDIVAGFFAFGLLAFVGAYFWYRATVDSVPFINKRWYAMFVFFAPSLVFWPSSIGKEALMLLGVGAMVLGLSQLLRDRVLRGLLIAAPGGWLVGLVRPHLLAMVVLGGGIAYLLGRNTSRREAASTSLMRPVGMIALLVIAVFALNQAAEFLGLEEFSVQAVEEELDEQTGRSAQGGSAFDTDSDEGGTRLTPLSVPEGAVTVLLRPFPWEVESGFQILASLEVTAITLFMLIRLPSLLLSLRYWRRAPFLAFCWAFIAMYSLAFASFANFGLLVRQRSLVLPALFVLIAVEPLLARRLDRDEAEVEPTETRTVPSRPDPSRPNGSGRELGTAVGSTVGPDKVPTPQERTQPARSAVYRRPGARRARGFAP